MKRIISIGTIDASLAHPREVLKPAIEVGASYVVLAHNHPSGDVDPSQADLLLTTRMCEAGYIMGIDVIDHIIVSENNWLSLKKEGMMDDCRVK